MRVQYMGIVPRGSAFELSTTVVRTYLVYICTYMYMHELEVLHRLSSLFSVTGLDTSYPCPSRNNNIATVRTCLYAQCDCASARSLALRRRCSTRLLCIWCALQLFTCSCYHVADIHCTCNIVMPRAVEIGWFCFQKRDICVQIVGSSGCGTLGVKSPKLDSLPTCSRDLPWGG